MSNPRKGPYVSEEQFTNASKTELNDPVGSRLRIEDSHGLGVANTFLKEPRPKYFFTPGATDKTISGRNNTHLIFGRNQPNSCWSGHGGKGHHKSGEISLIAGLAPHVKDGVFVNKNYTDDAAMLFISQKADVDTDFGLADGQVGNVKNRSAVSMKADCVRIVSRGGGIKLVTGGAQNTKTRSRGSGLLSGGNISQAIQDAIFTERDSSGGFSYKPAPGIELMAGNSDERQKLGFIGRILNGDDADSEVEILQPVPLGDNLNECLVKIIDEISTLNGKLFDLAATQRKFNWKLMRHVHVSAPPGLPTSPSPGLVTGGFIANVKIGRIKRGLVAQKIGLSLHTINYLRSFGAKWVCSENVRTT
jgi:hypothetical protein